MGIAEIFNGIIILSIGIGAFFFKGPIGGLMFVGLVASASVLAVPEAIGYCASPRMPCNYGAVPFLRLLGGATAAASLSGLLISTRARRR